LPLRDISIQLYVTHIRYDIIMHRADDHWSTHRSYRI